MRAIGIDISRYQGFIDWPKLAGVIDFAIIKCSEGHTWSDPLFASHVQGAYDAGIPAMAYHYFRHGYYKEYGYDANKWPSPANDLQLLNLKNALKNKALCGLWLDVEDASNNEAKWDAHAAGVFMGRIQDWILSEPARWGQKYQEGKFILGVYTAEWFWNQCKDEMSWMKGYPLWTARYPYAAGAVTTTWDAFKAGYLPPANTSIPTMAANGWTVWQFSGDKFILPHVYADASKRPTALDLNFYNGTRDELYQRIGFTPKSTTPVIETPTSGSVVVPPVVPSDLEARVAALEAWRERCRQ